MTPYVTFTKKRLTVLFSVFVCVCIICYEFYIAGNKIPNAKTNAQRVAFVEQAGYTLVDKNPTSKTVTIPEVFYDVYKNYNALQKKSGYDLSYYKGCEVIIYTYKINPPQNYSGEFLINIIVYNDRVIGGDVSSSTFGEYMLPI